MTAKAARKLDKEDINKANLAAGDDCIEIFAEFEELPASIIIDATNETTLVDEHLLTEAGTLKVIKRYPKAGKEKCSFLHTTLPRGDAANFFSRRTPISRSY
jgi:hypothetical protein